MYKKNKFMNILFIARSSAILSPGGDINQLKICADKLQTLRPEWKITVMASHFVLDYSCYDFLFFHNLNRPSDIMFHVKQSKLPFILSSLFIDYDLINKHSENVIVRYVKELNLGNAFEYVKTVARGILRRDQLPCFDYISKGHKRSMRWVIKHAHHVFGNSRSELDRIVDKLSLTDQSKLELINKYSIFKPGPSIQTTYTFEYLSKRTRDIDVLIVSRLDHGKGQLHVLKKLASSGLKVVVAGGPLDSDYGYKLRNLAGENITLMGQCTSEQLRDLYLRSRVHVLNSAFEVFGLVTLDALTLGCNAIVTDRGDQIEHFESYAAVMFFCDPDVRRIIDELREFRLTEQSLCELRTIFSWDRAAEIIVNVIEES